MNPRTFIEGNLQRKKQKSIHKQEDTEIVFCLKRKFGVEATDTIYISNEEQIMNIYNKQKAVKLDIESLIEKTNKLDINENQNKEVVVLRRMTEPQQIIAQKREQFAQDIRRQQRDKTFQLNRKYGKNQQVILMLSQNQDTLVCNGTPMVNIIQQEDDISDYYVMQTVQKCELQSDHKEYRLDTNTLEKCLQYDPYNDSDEDNDSDDSERTDNSKFDYPEDESSADDDELECYYGSGRNSYDVSERDQMESQCIQEEDEEVGDQPVGLQQHSLMNFLNQHRQYAKERNDWQSFNFVKDF